MCQLGNVMGFCNICFVPLSLRKSRFWHTFWHYKYGNCFTFNKNRGLKVGGPGPDYGKLMIFMLKLKD